MNKKAMFKHADQIMDKFEDLFLEHVKDNALKPEEAYAILWGLSISFPLFVSIHKTEDFFDLEMREPAMAFAREFFNKMLAKYAKQKGKKQK